MHVEVFLRRIPTEVRAKDTTGQEEGLVVITPQERGGTVGGLPVGRFLFRNVQRLPIRPIFVILVGHLVAHPMQQASLPGKRRPMLGRVLMVPGDRVGELAVRLMKNLATSLILSEKIVTSLPKAKELRKVAEPLITLAKQDSLTRRRLAYSRIQDKKAVKKLFEELGPRFKNRPGGYMRILKHGFKKGDSAPRAYVTLAEKG